MKPHKNNKHFQGLSNTSANRWGFGSFLDTEADFEVKGEVGSTLGDRRSPSAKDRGVAGEGSLKNTPIFGVLLS